MCGWLSRRRRRYSWAIAPQEEAVLNNELQGEAGGEWSSPQRPPPCHSLPRTQVCSFFHAHHRAWVSRMLQFLPGRGSRGGSACRTETSSVAGSASPSLAPARPPLTNLFLLHNPTHPCFDIRCIISESKNCSHRLLPILNANDGNEVNIKVEKSLST